MNHHGRARAAMRAVIGVGIAGVERQIIMGVGVHLRRADRIEPFRRLPIALRRLRPKRSRPAADREAFQKNEAPGCCSASRFRFRILFCRRASGSARRASCRARPSGRASPPGSAVRLFPPRPRPAPASGRRQQQEQPYQSTAREKSAPGCYDHFETQRAKPEAFAASATIFDICGGNRGDSAHPFTGRLTFCGYFPMTSAGAGVQAFKIGRAQRRPG